MEDYYYLSSLAYGICCCLYLFVFNNKKHGRLIQVFFKILPLTIVFYTGFRILFSSVAPFHIKGPFYVTKIRKVVFSLGISIIGDVYLLYPNMFIYGLVAFLCAHFLLILSFCDDLTIGHIRTPELTILLVIGLISTAVYIFIVTKLKCGLKTAVLIYTVAISMMLWTASLQMVKYYSPATVVGFIGALSFYISDIMLALNKWKFRIPQSDFLITATYYSAQYLICYSTVLAE